MTRLLFLLPLTFLIACGPSPRRIVLGGGTAPQPGLPNGGGNVSVTPGSASNLAPMERLNEVNSYLEQQGFERVGSAAHNRNLDTGGVMAHALEAQSGECYVAVALGANNSDVNMIVLDPQGQTVGHNVLPDPNPWVRVCANQDGRHIVRMQMASGSGEYFYAYYRGNQDPQLASLLGGAAPAQQQQALRPDAASAQRLEEINRRLSSQRFQRVGEVVGYQLENSGSRTVGLQLNAGQCYAFSSIGGQGAQDTDLAILTSSGETVINDRDSAVDAVVEYCPESSGRFELEATMYSGTGPIFLAGWVRNQNNTAVNTNTTNVIDTSATSSGLDETFALLNADITARGYESYGRIAQGQLAQAESQDFPLTLEGGKCYAIVAQGAGSVRDLDLVLRDSRNRELDRDVSVSSRPIVRVCPENSGEYQMAVRMTEGGGDFRYQAYRWPRGTRGPFGLNGLIYVRLGEVTSLLGQEGYQPSSNALPGQGNLARQGRSTHHDLELPASCVAVLVVGGDGVHDLDISLNQGSQRVAGDDSRNAFPNVRVCPQSAGTYRLNIEASAGSGAYYYQIFERN